MTEDEAHAWLADRYADDARTRLARFVAIVLEESERQNLVSASTRDSIWTRHVVDSAQLLPLAADVDGPWLDVGTGAGFPGMVVACLSDRPIALVEPPLRFDFSFFFRFQFILSTLSPFNF